MLKVFESFAGVGSQRMALRNIGIEFEVVGISEVDKYAILAYDAIHHDSSSEKQSRNLSLRVEDMLAEFKDKNIGYNFSTGKSELPKTKIQIEELYVSHKTINNFGDIRRINPSSLPNFDLFTYSMPCKDISQEGKKTGFSKGLGNQTSLVWECENIIREKLPSFLLMENVMNIVNRLNIGSLNEWIRTLDDIGYNSYWEIYNGIDFGVPQKRQRVIMVSILKEADTGLKELEKIDKCDSLIDLLEKNPSCDLFIDIEKYKNLISLAKEEDDWLYSVREANRKGYAEARVGDMIDVMQPNSKTRRGRVAVRACNTLNTSRSKCVVQGDGKIRFLSSLECWRLMGFSDTDYHKVKEKGLPESKLYERAGRGIIVPMLEKIFERFLHMKKIDKKETIKSVADDLIAYIGD
ncbi:MAG: DNA (cytosine-5-)-methyltransferase, partial [Fusobacteriaceae bacterium]